MSRKVIITLDFTIPDGLYEANENTLMTDMEKAAKQKLSELLVEYYKDSRRVQLTVSTECPEEV